MLWPNTAGQEHALIGLLWPNTVGPPGTGKTKVAVAILKAWVLSGQYRGQGILAAADSNIAVDNLVEGLVKANINAVRVGRPESIRPELERYSLASVEAGTKQEASVTAALTGFYCPAPKQYQWRALIDCYGQHRRPTWSGCA